MRLVSRLRTGGFLVGVVALTAAVAGQEISLDRASPAASAWTTRPTINAGVSPTDRPSSLWDDDASVPPVRTVFNLTDPRVAESVSNSQTAGTGAIGDGGVGLADAFDPVWEAAGPMAPTPAHFSSRVVAFPDGPFVPGQPAENRIVVQGAGRNFYHTLTAAAATLSIAPPRTARTTSLNSANVSNSMGTHLNGPASTGVMGPTYVISSASATGVPPFNSDPGAPYTVYLDFAGFSFSGTWGTSGHTPGTTPSFDGTTGPFSSTEQATIQEIWARVAEKYSPFSVNVTTVDPAVAAGKAGSDSTRQAFYDQTARLMHTVIGGDGAWNGGGGGVSYVGVTQYVRYDASLNNGAGGGYHTNWIFPANLGPNDPQAISEASAHENGHGFGLNHQSDFDGSGNLVTEYSTNNMAQGPGSYAPIMGASYYAQRGLWRSGNSYQPAVRPGPTPQNDPQVILGNSGMTPANDGVGHSIATATPLLANGTNIDFNTAKGIIVPSSATDPNPIGVNNYTSDYFSFNSFGGSVNVTAYDSAERISPGHPDPGGTLWSTLTLLDANGQPVGTPVTTDPSTQTEVLKQTIPAGRFYLEVSSAGGQTSSFDSSAQYYDMGDFFLTGVVPAPEPTSLLLVSLGATVILFYRPRRRVAG